MKAALLERARMFVIQQESLNPYDEKQANLALGLAMLVAKFAEKELQDHHPDTGKVIPEPLTLDEADELIKQTEYMRFLVDKDNPVNLGDASMFFIEGYNYARKWKKASHIPDTGKMVDKILDSITPEEQAKCDADMIEVLERKAALAAWMEARSKCSKLANWNKHTELSFEKWFNEIWKGREK